MANGFVTSSPTSRWGADNISLSYSAVWAVKFTAPSGYDSEISEIGVWGNPGTLNYAGDYPFCYLAIYAHNPTDNCPFYQIANSVTPALEFVGSEPVNYHKYNYVYPGTKPQIQAGQTYWLAILVSGYSSQLLISYHYTPRALGVRAHFTAYNWPTYSQWPSANYPSTEYNLSLYAVYAPLPVIITAAPLVSYSDLNSSGLLVDKILCPEFSSVGGLSADLFYGRFLTVDPLASQGILDASIGVGIPTDLRSVSQMDGTLSLSLLTSEMATLGQITVSDTVFIRDQEAQITYECVLVNNSESIVLPIESFQGYFRTNEPSYLGVVVPTIVYEDQVNAAIAAGSCTLSVFMIKTYKDGNVVRESIQVVDIDETGVRIDEGATNQSMTLSGYRQEVRDPKTAILSSSFKKSTQYSTDGIKYSYQCLPDLFLRAGDTVQIDGNEFTADSIRWEVNVERGQMTVLPV